MKPIIFIIIFLISLNVLNSNNTYIIDFNNDTCYIKKINILNEQISQVLLEYDKFKKANYYENNKKIIIFLDYKKLNDSTNIYIVTETMYLEELLQNIPSYYYIKDNSLICIYTGNEIANIDYECIEQLFLTGKNYCIDSIDAYSKKDLKFITKHRPVFFYDPPVIKIIICKGKIVYIDFVTTLPTRLYEKNMKNKLIIY